MQASPQKKIALFYHVVVRDNGIGRVNRLLLEHLCDKYDFTVFAVRFDNPCPERIRWIRVPSPARPVLAIVFTFRLFARLLYFWQRVIRRSRFDIVQASDAVFGYVQIADAHFCNRHYLNNTRDKTDLNSLRSLAQSATRHAGSFFERRDYKKAPVVVVPSAGLRRELISSHNLDPEKIRLISHAVDTSIWPPSTCDRSKARADVGLSEGDVCLVFAALGDFERKGLGILIDSLADERLHSTKLLVVGGSEGSLEPYRERAKAGNVAGRVVFAGRHESIRPFLWAADAFVLPSRYEVFPAVAIQAACSALPLITTHLNGVEEYALEGHTGFFIKECSPDAIADAVAKFLCLSSEARREIGLNSRGAVEGYTVERFVQAWDRLYAETARLGRSKPRRRDR